MAGAGLGVALVPEPVVQVGIPDIVYRPLNDPALCASLLRVSRKEEINGAARAWQALFRHASDAEDESASACAQAQAEDHAHWKL